MSYYTKRIKLCNTCFKSSALIIVMLAKPKFLIQNMFGKTDYIMIQEPKIASSTLLCNTNWQSNWPMYYKLWFLVEKRHSNLGISEIYHRRCLKKHPEPQEQKWILAQKRGKKASRIKLRGKTEKIKKKPQEKQYLKSRIFSGESW